jgi:predicted extracellular nuclease
VIKVGDVITVTGKLQNYNGVQIANGQIQVYPKAMTEAEILAAAAALASGESLPGTHSLTGEVVSIDSAYSEQFGNITVTIKVGDVELQCYRMKGGADLAVGDTITVTGEIKNYNGKVQFNTGATYVEAE